MLTDTLPLPGAPLGGQSAGDQAAGLRRLMARALRAPPAPPAKGRRPITSAAGTHRPLRVAVLAPDPELARWMCRNLADALDAPASDASSASAPGVSGARSGVLDLPPEAGLSLGDEPAHRLLAQADPVLLVLAADAPSLSQSLTWAYARLKRVHGQDALLPPERRLMARLHVVLAGVAHAAQAQLALANLSRAVRDHLGLALPPGTWLLGASTQDFDRLAAEMRQWPRTSSGSPGQRSV